MRRMEGAEDSNEAFKHEGIFDELTEKDATSSNLFTDVSGHHSIHGSGDVYSHHYIPPLSHPSDVEIQTPGFPDGSKGKRRRAPSTKRKLSNADESSKSSKNHTEDVGKAISPDELEFMKNQLDILEKNIIRGTEIEMLIDAGVQDESIDIVTVGSKQKDSAFDSDAVAIVKSDKSGSKDSSSNSSKGFKKANDRNTKFVGLRVRHQVREIYGLYKLIVAGTCSTKSEAAKIMSSTSPYSARTILSWARDYFRLNGKFNRFKGGKYKRRDLIEEDPDFAANLKNWCLRQGKNLSVDAATQYVNGHVKSEADSHDSKGYSRSTVARWMIRLGCTAPGGRNSRGPPSKSLHPSC